MRELLEHTITPLLEHPEDLNLSIVEGEAVTLIEVSVHDDDLGNVSGEDDSHLRALRRILSIASGAKKASLELVYPAEESATDEDSSENVAEGQEEESPDVATEE
jgi:predicted RNA-binding protein YlqC (UPF0109 family)